MKKKNFILVQMKREDGTTITTFDGEPHHAEHELEVCADKFSKFSKLKWLAYFVFHDFFPFGFINSSAVTSPPDSFSIM
jgi:hypothetical protein